MATRAFLVHEDQRVGFEGLSRAAPTVLHALVDAGVAKGDRLAIAMRNLPEGRTAHFGTLLAGAIAVPLKKELRALFGDAA